jgi:putative transposase
VERKLAPEVNAELMGRWEPIYRSQLHYLVTWSTRGRRPVLKERHAAALADLIRQTCDDRGYTLLDAVAGPDHVHVLLGMSPTSSVASAVREIKGSTGLQLLAHYPELRVWLRGNLVWDERYSVETVSAMRLEKVRDRLRALHSGDDQLAAAS